MDDPEKVGYIVGAFLTGIVGFVALVRRLGWKLFGPPPQEVMQKMEEIKKGVNRVDHTLSSMLQDAARVDERIKAIDRRVTILEKSRDG